MTASPLLPTRLRCAQQVNPLGVSPDRVRLSWALAGTGRDRLQRAYQIRLWKDTPDDPVWDSGRVESSASVDISYAGPAGPRPQVHLAGQGVGRAPDQLRLERAGLVRGRA